MSPESSTDSYPAFAHVGLGENPGKNLNQKTMDRLRRTWFEGIRRTNTASDLYQEDDLDREMWRLGTGRIGTNGGLIGNEPPGSLKASKALLETDYTHLNGLYQPAPQLADRTLHEGNITCATQMLMDLSSKSSEHDFCRKKTVRVIVGGRRIKYIRFADDMALLAQEEMILKDMLLELNDSCEQYGMKINANKTKSMVIGRKIQKTNLIIPNEAVDNMSFCQEVKRRIAMAKEAYNRKSSIFCGPLEKELKKRLVKCFVWSVALYGAEIWTLRRSEEKRIEAFEM
ncbi:hypothetical protein ANN_08257 [Periplaneta americana]|uniref:Reverse transcriptase domain-containing protein n=1 Tax=Periplaneta americana TaxID=6978 RepID=A0ABQ8T2G3_PERAM|nr:hypothetical protein ANN_08257 [Periplaneta americana]